MSTNIQINVTDGFDGATTVDLAAPDSTTSDGILVYNFPTVGVFDLDSIPNLDTSDKWLQEISAAFVVPGPLVAVATIPATSPFPVDQMQTILDSGGVLPSPPPPLPTVPVNSQYNAIIPQDQRIKVSMDGDPAGVLASLFLSLWEYGDREWPFIQCCHVWRPVVPPAN